MLVGQYGGHGGLKGIDCLTLQFFLDNLSKRALLIERLSSIVAGSSNILSF
jgi:hypothetical protein